MKHTLLLTTLTAGLIINTGCGKKEDTATQSSSPAPLDKPAVSIPEVTAAAETKIQETAQAAVEEAKEIVSSYTAQAEEVAKNTVQTYTVKAEEILNEITEPVSAVKEKVASYSQPELLARAEQYKEVILEKKEQLTGLTTQLKELGVADLFSEQGKALKAKVSQYTGELTALKDRYSVYLDKLKAMNINIPGFDL